MSNRKKPIADTTEAVETARDYAKQNLGQIREANEQFLASMADAQDTFLQSTGLSSNAFQNKAMEYTKANITTAYDLATKMVDAADITEVLELQSTYARSQMEAYGSQARVLSKLATETAEKMAKTK